MQYIEVSPLKPLGDITKLTYQTEEELEPGHIIEVPVGDKMSYGVVMNVDVKKPEFETKSAGKLVEDTPLPQYLLDFVSWIESYYVSPLSSVWQTVLPRGFHKNRRKKFTPLQPTGNSLQELTSEQRSAIRKFGDSSATVLVHGVTGSGKTRVYIEAAKKKLEAGKSTIVLVPEINLTTQIIDEFKALGAPIVVTHSGLTESERHTRWLFALNSSEPIIIIGPRSALFMPLRNLGLIVVDESHEDSYKQEQNPKYHALYSAFQYRQYFDGDVISGSATPSIKEYYLSEKLERPILTLKRKVHREAKNKIHLIDLKEEKGNPTITKPLKDGIIEATQNERQALLFLNRRGSARFMQCKGCGYIAECQRCALPLTFHADEMQLKCHVCDMRLKVLAKCPECKEADFIFKGVGTKSLETTIKSQFPNKKVMRLDQDSFSPKDASEIYESLKTADIIVGTQMVAKGLDLPRVDCVGVIRAETSLYIPDYTASERTFQLLHQVAGRAGRRKKTGNVYIQTYTPEHPAITYALKNDYHAFYEHEINERKKFEYPPFSFMMKVTASRSSGKSAALSLEKFLKKQQNNLTKVLVLGPAPSFHEKRGSQYRWNVVLKSAKRNVLQQIADEAPSSFSVDIDPINLL